MCQNMQQIDEDVMWGCGKRSAWRERTKKRPAKISKVRTKVWDVWDVWVAWPEMMAENKRLGQPWGDLDERPKACSDVWRWGCGCFKEVVNKVLVQYFSSHCFPLLEACCSDRRTKSPCSSRAPGRWLGDPLVLGRPVFQGWSIIILKSYHVGTSFDFVECWLFFI